jgi:hypothetical protein
LPHPVTPVDVATVVVVTPFTVDEIVLELDPVDEPHESPQSSQTDEDEEDPDDEVDELPVVAPTS